MAEIIEEEIEIQLSEGISTGFLYHPASNAHSPGVLFLTDIFGIRQSMRDMARRLSGKGYTVLMPNVFHRAGSPPMFNFPFVMGEERTTKRMVELRAALTPENVKSDAPAYVDFLLNRQLVRDGVIGVVGHCFTGAVAMRIGAARADKVAAVASFHGGQLYTADPSSPHLRLPQIAARLYFGHAVEDKGMPPEAIEKLEVALKAWGGKFESEIYAGAHHGWTVPDSDVYNQLRPSALSKS